MKRGSVWGWCVVLLAAAGCYSTYDPYYYDYGYYDPYYYTYDAAYAYAWYDPIYGVWYRGSVEPYANPDPNAAASTLAANVNTYFTPAGCATATANGATVSYTFNNCSGPAGLTAITGNATVTFTNNAGNPVATVSSTDLTVNGAPYHLSLQITANPPQGNTRSVTIVSNSFSPDRFDERTSQSTITWQAGSGCFTLNGTDQGVRHGLNATSTITDLVRCTGQCAQSGNITVNTGVGTFNAAANGSNEITVTAPNGHTKKYNQNC